VLKVVASPHLYRLGHLGLDGLVAWIACSLAYWLRFDGVVSDDYLWQAIILPLIAIPGRLLTQHYRGVYLQIWRLFSLQDAVTIVQAVSLYSGFTLVVTRGLLPQFHSVPGIPLGVLVIDWSLCFLGMVSLRYWRRWFAYPSHSQAQAKQQRLNRKRLLLVGAGMTGAQVVQEIHQNPQLNLEVIGFIDDDPTKVGRKVEGTLVLGSTTQLAEIAHRLRADQVLVAMPSAKPAQIRTIVELGRTARLPLRILPGQGEILRNRHLVPQAREIKIQDILGRQEIQLDLSTVFHTSFLSAQEQINQKTILVTGAGGTIGSEICRQLARLNPRHLLLLGRGENSIFSIHQELSHNYPDVPTVAIIADIRNSHRMQQVFEQWQPDVVFHAAAHKHVPLMQQNPIEAIENNTLGSAYLAQLADKHSVKTFVMISTDKAVEPTSFMGLSKRLAELIVRAYATHSETRYLVVRFGNVLGSRGSVVPIFETQIAKGGPVTITDPAMNRYFMTSPEAAQLVIQGLGIGQSGQVLILDMGKPVKIYKLAQQMILLAGLEPEQDIPIQITGIRPGEKLHESLIASSERIMPTAHSKIMVVAGPGFDISMQETVKFLTKIINSDLPIEKIWSLVNTCIQNLESGQVKSEINPE
jgi:FlaA1/EpsC-like NDP-sugar epimerase